METCTYLCVELSNPHNPYGEDLIKLITPLLDIMFKPSIISNKTSGIANLVTLLSCQSFLKHRSALHVGRFEYFSF